MKNVDVSISHGEQVMNSENSRNECQSGDSDASDILNTEISESPMQRMMTSAHTLRIEQMEPSGIVSSKDLGDPDLGTVLQAHIDQCLQCVACTLLPPPAFGMPDKRHCPEYFEIIQEYSDYERDYISKGNP
jgi:hypothetical protein